MFFDDSHVFFAGTGRAGAVECGRSDGRGRRAACRLEGTARGRGHVRGAEALCQGRGEQVREEVQTVRCVTTAWRCAAVAGRVHSTAITHGYGTVQCAVPHAGTPDASRLRRS